jgi:SAM-dependent methyltransferase
MTRSTEFSYVGSELELFANATNWKKYIGAKLRPYISGSVIEVGAGLGSSTKYLCDQSHARWLCLDPDARHVAHLNGLIASRKLPACCKARRGILADLAPDQRADTIIYVDVLEHIESDEAEMRTAAAHLAPRGHIVVLSPAFNFLYSPFDESIGHYRRYERKDAKRLTAQSLTLRALFFLDSIGFFASAANRLIMRKSQPSSHDIQIWDKALVPISVISDIILGRLFGKSIVMIWQKT